MSVELRSKFCNHSNNIVQENQKDFEIFWKGIEAITSIAKNIESDWTKEEKESFFGTIEDCDQSLRLLKRWTSIKMSRIGLESTAPEAHEEKVLREWGAVLHLIQRLKYSGKFIKFFDEIAKAERAECDLLERNKGLIGKLIDPLRKRNRCNCANDDIMADGLIGLMRAIYGFDPKKAKFSTYAYSTINNELSKKHVGGCGSPYRRPNYLNQITNDGTKLLIRRRLNRLQIINLENDFLNPSEELPPERKYILEQYKNIASDKEDFNKTAATVNYFRIHASKKIATALAKTPKPRNFENAVLELPDGRNANPEIHNEQIPYPFISAAYLVYKLTITHGIDNAKACTLVGALAPVLKKKDEMLYHDLPTLDQVATRMTSSEDQEKTVKKSEIQRRINACLHEIFQCIHEVTNMNYDIYCGKKIATIESSKICARILTIFFDNAEQDSNRNMEIFGISDLPPVEEQCNELGLDISLLYGNISKIEAVIDED